MAAPLYVGGVGLVTDVLLSIADAAPNKLPPFELLDPETVSSEERLAALAIRAAHQAHTMARLAAIDPDRIGLIYVSCWGSIDATVAYLDSMLQGEGKFASPRHFSRSVYSAVASALAMHFQIHGPCLTLAFPPADAVAGALAAARRLIAAARATHLLLVWADQSSPLVADLARRAAEGLGDATSRRYAERVGEGAAAAVVQQETSSLVHADEEPRKWEGNPFAMDLAAAWVSGFRLRD